jgi:RNA polymerase sigma-70 factor (ECF subfamily)
MRVSIERTESEGITDAIAVEGNSHDAEEVVQEAFLRAYQKLSQFAGNSNFGTWVYRIAANYSIDRIRQRNVEAARQVAFNRPTEDGSEVDPTALLKDPSASPERLAGSAELAARMKQALDALTPAERTAIVMRHWEGCAIEEIAVVLKSNSNATKNTVFRAVAKLRRALEPFSEFRNTARAMGTES